MNHDASLGSINSANIRVPAWAAAVAEEDPEIEGHPQIPKEELGALLSPEQLSTAWKIFLAYTEIRGKLRDVSIDSISREGSTRERNVWTRWALWVRRERAWIACHGK